MKITNWLLVAVLAIPLISGCQSYKDGQSRTVGELTDDTAIQFRVKTKLTGARDVKGLFMNVEVKKGVVTLYGRVDSEAMRQRAVDITKSVKGVVSVEDRLTIRGSPGS